jgi:pyruvate/2-oxoglutarate/acetoin dehydrogenase E1 component
VTREGDDLTIVAIGKMVAVAEETADKLLKRLLSYHLVLLPLINL